LFERQVRGFRRAGIPTFVSRRDEWVRRPEAETIVEERAPVVEEEEVAPPPPPPRGPLLWPWLLLLLLLVLGGLAAAWYFTNDDNGGSSASTVDVPIVVHLQQQEAVGRLNRRGLVARVVTRASTAPPGVVFAQDPRPGADVTRRSVVTIAVSAQRTQAVPDVVGRRAAAAVAALRANGFRVRVESVVSTKPLRTVLGQSPVAGARVAGGSTVVIRVSRGLVTVPATVGQTRDAAVSALRAAGLVPKAVTVPSSQPKGTVVAQNPTAGKRVEPGSSVRLNISNGSAGTGAAAPPPPPPPAPPPPPPPATSATVTVPDVTGQAQASAQRQLTSAGLRVTLVYVPSDQPLGRVISQSPRAEASAKRNARVRIRAALGPTPGEQRVVPKLAGLDRDTAISRLQAAGFKVQTLRQTVSDRSQVGKVVDEQPGGGTRAPAGSTVTIYLGRLG
jgi:beta-lactam-binding protein with PASTA domain